MVFMKGYIDIMIYLFLIVQLFFMGYALFTGGFIVNFESPFYEIAFVVVAAFSIVIWIYVQLFINISKFRSKFLK